MSQTFVSSFFFFFLMHMVLWKSSQEKDFLTSHPPPAASEKSSLWIRLSGRETVWHSQKRECHMPAFQEPDWTIKLYFSLKGVKKKNLYIKMQIVLRCGIQED